MADTQGHVIPVRYGGLGNQMFQVAAAIVLAKETDKRVLIADCDETNHNTVGDYAVTFFHNFMRVPTVVKDSFPGFSKLPGGPYGFQEWSVPKDCPQNVIMDGYFQYYPPIGKHENTIRGYFLANLPVPKRRFDTYVGIHVRRGDYLRSPDFHFIQSTEYYEKAMLTFYPMHQKYVVFSDDIAWCKEQPVFSRCVFADDPNELQALVQMTTCTGGFICGNSTFSWWGAFLGPYASRQTICVPHKWINTCVYNLFPPEWRVV